MIKNLFTLLESTNPKVASTECKRFTMTMHIHVEDPVSKAISEMSPSKLSVRDIYLRLCACLDREIELVWKRATFLTAFLIAAFAGYGGLIATYLGAENHAGDFAIVSIAAIGIAFVGMALSVIWIMMAKGSKAWQEHYEKVIECFVKNHASKDELQDICASGNYLQGNPDPTIKKYELSREKISGGLFNCSGGPYSVSTIVIGMGQGSLLVWGVVAVIHMSAILWKWVEPVFPSFSSPMLRESVVYTFAVIGGIVSIATLLVIIAFLFGKLTLRFPSRYLSRLRDTIP